MGDNDSEIEEAQIADKILLVTNRTKRHHPLVFTPERSKEETQEKSQDQTLRAEAVQSLYNNNYVNAKPVF
jgi:hypothetical protein